MANKFCCNMPFAASEAICEPFPLPRGMESFTIEKMGDGSNLIVTYKVTIKYHNCYPVEKTYVNIEDFYEEYNIKFQSHGK